MISCNSKISFEVTRNVSFNEGTQIRIFCIFMAESYFCTCITCKYKLFSPSTLRLLSDLPDSVLNPKHGLSNKEPISWLKCAGS